MFAFLLDRRSNTFSGMTLVVLASVACCGPMIPAACAQQAGANYDEAKVGHFPPLDPLTTADGRKVTTPDLWSQVRRPELLRLFETEMYGKVPQPPEPIRPMVRLRSEDTNALGGTAVRREVTIAFSENLDGPRMDLLIYLPKDAGPSRRAPAFLGLNFGGNQTIHRDPGIAPARPWTRPSPGHPPREHQAAESTRGSASSRWPVERIIARGYALATIYYEDIDPDFDDGFKNGIHPLFYRPGQTRPAPDEWGSIAAWAWGLQPGARFPRDHARDRREEGRRDGPLAAGEDGTLGRGDGPAVRRRDLE